MFTLKLYTNAIQVPNFWKHKDNIIDCVCIKFDTLTAPIVDLALQGAFHDITGRQTQISNACHKSKGVNGDINSTPSLPYSEHCVLCPITRPPHHRCWRLPPALVALWTDWCQLCILYKAAEVFFHSQPEEKSSHIHDIVPSDLHKLMHIILCIILILQHINVPLWKPCRAYCRPGPIASYRCGVCGCGMYGKEIGLMGGESMSALPANRYMSL